MSLSLIQRPRGGIAFPNLSDFSYSGNFWNTGITTWYGIGISPDGTKVYTVQAEGSNNVNENDLATPWEIDTRSGGANNNNLDVTNRYGVQVHPDGGQMFFQQDSGADELVYDWPISGYTIVGATSGGETSVDIGGTVASPRGLYIKPDGTAFWTLDGTVLYEFSMPTPWVMVGASFTESKTLTQSNNGLAFSTNGMKLFTIAGNTLRQYNLITPWDISTLSAADESMSLTGQTGSHRSFCFGKNGKRIYTVISTGNGTIYQYDAP